MTAVRTGLNQGPGLAAAVGMFQRLLRSEYLVFLLSAAYFLLLAPFAPGFASAQNLGNIAANVLPLFIVSVGQTYVLITGGIDLSAVSTIGLASISGAFVMSSQQGWLGGSLWAVPVGIGAMVAVGVLLGLLNGSAIAALRMPAFIVTLTFMMFCGGLAIWLTQSQKIGGLPGAFTVIGKNIWLTLLLTSLLGAAAHLCLSRTLLGRWLYAVGHNPRAALVSGVPVNRVVISAYVVSGVCASAAAIIYTGRLETGDPVLVQKILLDIVGATVIGGTSLYGGKGKVIWTLFGVLFITLIDNSLNLMGHSHFTIMMVKGGVILAAAIIDSLKNRWVPRSG
jgi:ribose/xylose/arabinose/galactoside ABC-type transport system permease subunit